MCVSRDILKSDVDYKSYRLKPGEMPDLYDESEDECDLKSDDKIVHDAVENQDDIIEDEFKPSSRLRKAAAALCIHVGSYADPVEAQGLAHFLEHMVFMGSEKYPRENDFDDYVSQRDGSSNACTDGEYTMFYFDIQRCHFKAGLDKFANFFCAPLLRRDCVDRELEAVNSEFELAKANDHCRIEKVLTSIAKEGSPYRTFVYGNRKSLKDNPSIVGTDVYSLLREFQLRYYTAPLMTLAVESKDTLDNLQQLVTEIFRHVPNRGNCKLDLCAHRDPFQLESFNKLYKICPVKETVSLSFAWSLPPMQNHYKAAPLKLLGCIVGHEGKGSLLAYLRKQNLAVELTAGTSTSDNTQHNQMNSLFQIAIELSELGRNSVNIVTLHVFSYLRMLREAIMFSLAQPEATTDPTGGRSFATLVPEYQQLYEVQFRFLEPLEPCDTVQHVAQTMLNSPPEEVYVYENLITKPDLKLYCDLVCLLTSDRANISLVLPEFNQQFEKSSEACLIEPWFDICYKAEDIPVEQMKIWLNPPIVPEFHLPEVNRFIATKFALLPSSQNDAVPRDLNLNPGREVSQSFGKLWHQQQTKFNVPIAHVMTTFRSKLPKCPKIKVLHQLWASMLDQRLQTLAYSATQANLNFSIEVSREELIIYVAGFNEKLFLLYAEIISLIGAPLTGTDDGLMITEKTFAVYKDRLRQKTGNRVLNPSKFNCHIRQYFSNAEEFLVDDFMKALELLTLDDFKAFVPQMLSQLFLVTFAYGNISSQEAIPFFDFPVSTFKCLPGSPNSESLLPQYPAGINRLRVMNFNKQDVNTCLALVAPLPGTPSDDLYLEVMIELFASCLKEPAFAYLRTLETLGYVVALYPWILSGSTRQSGVTLLVCSQASTFDTTRVAGRMYAFWFRIIPQIIFNLKPASFRTAVDALIATNQLEDATMMVELKRNKDEILSGKPVFDRREKMVSILHSITLKDLRSFYTSTLYDGAKQPLLMLQVDSDAGTNRNASNTSSAYHEVNLGKFDWPVSSVPVTEEQLNEETNSAQNVDLNWALESCAAGLIELTSLQDVELPVVPRISPINDPRIFKNSVLFPTASSII